MGHHTPINLFVPQIGYLLLKLVLNRGIAANVPATGLAGSLTRRLSLRLSALLLYDQ